MGLFGDIFKGIGKIGGGVLKAVASKATGGLSDSLLGALKNRGAAKAAAKANTYNLQQLALAEKMKPLAPKLSSSERNLDDALSGEPGEWNPGMRDAYNDPYGRKRYPRGYSAAKLALARRPPMAREYLAPREQVRATVKKAAKATRRPAKPHRPKRQPPSGGLDLRALSASWKAAGKPGTWQGWIAQNK